MCITTQKAHLSGTKILSLPLDNGRHFIAYSNSVKNSSGKPNAMILPIDGTTKPEWFHNTEGYKGFLDEIIRKSSMDSWLPMKTLRSAKGFRGHQEFLLGMYTIGLADSLDGMHSFIESLPEGSRPEMSEDLKNFLSENYSGWSFAVCCFDSNKTMEAQPIAFEYEPFKPELLYYPTMDAHDGGAPKVDGDKSITADHTFIFEHNGPREKEYKKDSISLDGVPDFLNQRKYRHIRLSGPTSNGDTYMELSEMSSLEFSVDPKLKRV